MTASSASWPAAVETSSCARAAGANNPPATANTSSGIPTRFPTNGLLLRTVSRYAPVRARELDEGRALAPRGSPCPTADVAAVPARRWRRWWGVSTAAEKLPSPPNIPHQEPDTLPRRRPGTLMAEPLLDRIHSDVRARVRELEPAVREYQRLEVASVA